MAIARRTFLKSIFTSSALLAGATPNCLTATQSWKQSETPIKTPTILVQTSTSMDDIFLQGIEAANRENAGNPVTKTVLESFQQTDPIILQQIFSSLKGSKLIGLMEDVPFVLFQAVARTHGASFLFTGQHSWSCDKSYSSRHHMITVPQCQGVSSVLATSLAASNQGYIISEKSLGLDREMKIDDQSSLIKTNHWAAITGEVLVKISAGDWQAAQVGNFQRKKQGKNRYDSSGSLVSFVIEV